jgi:hypothetical protein
MQPLYFLTEISNMNFDQLSIVISIMKVLFLAFLIALGNTFIYKGPEARSHQLTNARTPKLVLPPARQTSLSLQNRSAPVAEGDDKRKLFLDDLHQSYSAFDMKQMDNTNTQTSEMQAHNRRSAQLRQMGSWFGDLDTTVDDYRDSIAKKLDQLNMSLQRPKIPVPGFGAAMTLPFFNMPQQNLASVAFAPMKMQTTGTIQNSNEVMAAGFNGKDFANLKEEIRKNSILDNNSQNEAVAKSENKTSNESSKPTRM